METINLLLAHSDRRVNNLLEVAVLDVCYDRAAVQCTRTGRLDEFVRMGSLREYHLMVVGADHLLVGGRSRDTWASTTEVAAAIDAIRSQRSTPLIAVAAEAGGHALFLEAGADSALEFPLDGERFKTEVRRLLKLAELSEPVSGGRRSMGTFLRGFQRAKLAH